MNMGYAHYWLLPEEIPPATWDLIRRDSEKLIQALPDSIEDSWLDNTEIGFNGGCETFFLNREGNDRGCCKTGYVPCDKLVCAILSIAKSHHPALSVSSDARLGSEPDGWADACAWASQVLGREVRLPWGNCKTDVNTAELASGAISDAGAHTIFLDLTDSRPSGLRGLWRSALRRLNL
jgi:hypothetical protein